MGEKYEVMEWCGDTTWCVWEQRYYGRSLLKALTTLFKLKRAGAGCVKLIAR